MQRKGTLLIVISLLFTFAGCSVAKRASRSPETDALLRAARTGNADTVRTLLASPNVDVNGLDKHGNTPLIEAASLPAPLTQRRDRFRPDGCTGVQSCL